ncbi:MAG: hypothetical protein ACRYFX_18875 [Janthinobacterium lividum]
MTKIFFDTEFTGLHQATTLISIGLVAEGGESFYAELTDYDQSQINDWLRDNVISHLQLASIPKNRVFNGALAFPSKAGENHEVVAPMTSYCHIRGSKEVVAAMLTQWLEKFTSASINASVQFWSDCLAYDWVLLNALLADYSEGYPQLPPGLNYIPMDICPLLQLKGIDPDVSREHFAFGDAIYGQDFGQLKHNALWDARVIKACYEKLTA